MGCKAKRLLSRSTKPIVQLYLYLQFSKHADTEVVVRTEAFWCSCSLSYEILWDRELPEFWAASPGECQPVTPGPNGCSCNSSISREDLHVFGCVCCFRWNLPHWLLTNFCVHKISITRADFQHLSTLFNLKSRCQLPECSSWKWKLPRPA